MQRSYERRSANNTLSRNRIVLVVALALALAAIAVGLYRFGGTSFDWKLFFSTLSSIDPAWLSACIFLILVTYVGRALRWQVMMRTVRPHPNLWNLISATVIGFTAVVLFGRPGELVRPYLISLKERVSFSSQIAVWLLERIYDLLIVLILFGFGLSRVNEAAPIGPNFRIVLQTGGYLAAGLALICIAILFIVSNFADLAERRLLRGIEAVPEKFRPRIQQVLTSFIRGISGSSNRYFVTQIVVYTIVEWALIVGSIYCLFRAYPPTTQFSLVDTLVFTGFIAFGSAVQVPGIGGGMQVAGVLVLTELFGLSFETSAGMALFLWITTWLVITPFGVIFAAMEGMNWRSLKQIKSKAEELQRSEIRVTE